MKSFRTMALAVSGLCGLIAPALVAPAGAALTGAVYEPGGTLNTTAGAVAAITGTPTVRFTSNNVNGINYDGNDNSPIATFLGSDSTTITNGSGSGTTLLGTAVVNETGIFLAPTTGTYTFSSTNDDGGGFFVDGSPATPGSGTSVAIDDGQHGTLLVSGTLTLPAGTHNVEYVYYNSTIGGGGGANSDAVKITDPVGAAVVTAVPEPASLGLLGLGALGMLARRRRTA